MVAADDLEDFGVGVPPNNGVVDRTHFDANVTSRNLWEFYLPAFQACLVDAKAGSVMASFNSINGVPSTANGPLINGVLRKEWGADFFTVSDYDGWQHLVDPQGYAPNYTTAAAIGINAGMDQEGGGNVAVSKLPAAVAAGATTAEAIATSFRRLFAYRIRLGMLDPPTLVNYNNISYDVCASAPHIALAREAARKGAALYTNRKQALPLAATDFADVAGAGNLAVIGPNAACADCLNGNYATASTSGPGLAVSILAGIQNWGGSTGARQKMSVQYAAGCVDVTCSSTAGFSEAVAAAKSAKATVLVLGTAVAQHINCSSKVACEGEGHDRNSTAFGGHQYQLAAAVSAVCPRVICVIVHGAAMALGSLLHDCDAILDVGYPGAQGGNGVADVLFGAYSPAGRAATTWYADDKELPPYGEMDL